MSEQETQFQTSDQAFAEAERLKGIIEGEDFNSESNEAHKGLVDKQAKAYAQGEALKTQELADEQARQEAEQAQAAWQTANMENFEEHVVKPLKEAGVDVDYNTDYRDLNDMYMQAAYGMPKDNLSRVKTSHLPEVMGKLKPMVEAYYKNGKKISLAPPAAEGDGKGKPAPEGKGATPPGDGDPDPQSVSDAPAAPPAAGGGKDDPLEKALAIGENASRMFNRDADENLDAWFQNPAALWTRTLQAEIDSGGGALQINTQTAPTT